MRISTRTSASLFALLLIATTLLAQHGYYFGSNFTAAGGGTSNSFTKVTGVTSFDQACTNNSSGTSCNNTNDSFAGNAQVTMTSGGLYMVIFITNDGGTSTLACSDTSNGSWTALGSPKRGTGNAAGFSWQSFYVISGSTVTPTVTCSTSGTGATNTFHSWGEVGFTATGTISTDGTPAGVQVVASSSVATYSSAITTTLTNSLVVATCAFVSTSCTAGSGWTGVDTPGTGWNNQTGGLMEFKTVTTAGSQSPTFGSGATDDVGGTVMAFKAQ